MNAIRFDAPYPGKIRKENADATLAVILAVSEAIREKREIPSGELYAQLMPHGCTLAQHEAILSVLKGAGLVDVTGDLIRWTGPEMQVTP